MTEAAAQPPAGDELVPGWLERLAAVGWRLLAAILLGLVLLCDRRRAVDGHGVDPGRGDHRGDVRALCPQPAQPRLVADQGRGGRLPRCRVRDHRDADHHRHRLHPVYPARPGCRVIRASRPSRRGWPTCPSRRGRCRRGPGRRAVSRPGCPRASPGSPPTSVRSPRSRILATFLTFFFMMDGDKAWVWALSSANTWRRDEITTSGHVALERVGGYLRGTAVIAAVDGVAEGLFLVLLGVPLAAPARGDRLLRQVHPVHRRVRDDRAAAPRHLRLAGTDGGRSSC